MTNYTVTEYATQALLDAAIIALDTTTTFDVITYRDSGATKYCLVSPHPRGSA